MQDMNYRKPAANCAITLAHARRFPAIVFRLRQQRIRPAAGKRPVQAGMAANALAHQAFKVATPYQLITYKLLNIPSIFFYQTGDISGKVTN
jgi:hypothetical protein